MFPPSIHPFAHRCRLHSRLLTIASNYPHYFFFFFFFAFTADEIFAEPCLSCVCVCAAEADEERERGLAAGRKKR